jgi:hypothetical protein
MIVIEGGTLLEPSIVAITVVVIVIENGYLVRADALHDPPHDGGLARPGAPSDTDDDCAHARRGLRLVGWTGGLHREAYFTAKQ